MLSSASNITRCAILLFAPLLVGFVSPAAPAGSASTSESAKVAAPRWEAFDGRRAFDHLRRQVDFGPRVPGSEGHTRCLAWAEKAFRDLGYTTKRQTFRASLAVVGHRPVKGVNLYADLPSSPTRRIALTAHWDTRPVADLDPDRSQHGRPIPGANDGASGVAVLLELARLFRESPPEVGVVFVLFDIEDAGRYSRMDEWCLGSRYSARRWPKEWPIEWGINLDMIGDRNLLIKRDVESTERANDLVERVWAVGLERAPQAFSLDRWPPILDDHVPFLDAGVPFIDMIDYDYPPWHTMADDVSQCSPRSLEVVGRVVAEVVYKVED